MSRNVSRADPVRYDVSWRDWYYEVDDHASERGYLTGDSIPMREDKITPQDVDRMTDALLAADVGPANVEQHRDDIHGLHARELALEVLPMILGREDE